MSEMHVPGASHESHGEHEAHHVNYLAIFLILCGLTVVSIIADLVAKENKIILGIAVLTVASFKAIFVMLYFMHLKFEGRWKYVLLAPTVILALCLILALMPDIGLHYYSVATPQVDAWEQHERHPGAHHRVPHEKGAGSLEGRGASGEAGLPSPGGANQPPSKGDK